GVGTVATENCPLNELSETPATATGLPAVKPCGVMVVMVVVPLARTAPTADGAATCQVARPKEKRSKFASALKSSSPQKINCETVSVARAVPFPLFESDWLACA